MVNRQKRNATGGKEQKKDIAPQVATPSRMATSGGNNKKEKTCLLGGGAGRSSDRSS